MSDDKIDPNLPPMIPESTEKIITANPQFLKDCFLSLSHFSKEKIDNSKYICTKSSLWGVIFRVDFSIDPTENPKLVNRMICWQPTSGKFHTLYAVGQDIPQLIR